MPDTDEVDQALRSPLRVDTPRPQMTVRPFAGLAFELGLQRHQYCRIYRDQVCTTNDCLGNMLGESDPATGDDRNLVPKPLSDKLLMHIFQRCRDMPGIPRIVPAVIVSIQVQPVYTLAD